MNILLVEDSVETLNFLTEVISVNYSNIKIFAAKNYDEAITLLDSTLFDLFILDYELDIKNPSKNGLALGQIISKNAKYKKTPIVFETNFPEYIMEAVNTLNCAYYLVKPFNEKHILAMLSKVLNNVTSPSLLYFRNSEGIETHIAISDIVFIKSLRHNIEVCTKHKTLNFANYSLTQLEEDAASILVRCHKSYLISLKYVSDIDKSNNYVTLSANDKNITIPIGRKYANNLYERTTQ